MSKMKWPKGLISIFRNFRLSSFLFEMCNVVGRIKLTPETANSTFKFLFSQHDCYSTTSTVPIKVITE